MVGREHRRGEELRSFGRRRGRKPSNRQRALFEELLPTVQFNCPDEGIATLSSAFPKDYDSYWLEIGFGGGEHLVWQAETYPDVGLIGCEPFEDGVIKVLDEIERKQLKNIRIYTDDARDVLRALPPSSLSRIFILFPDPWPKLRHHKRRLVTKKLVNELARVLKPGGELRLGTDIRDYAYEMVKVLTNSGDFTWLVQSPTCWRQRPEDWPPTRYEQKAIEEGRDCVFLRWRKK